MHRLTLRLLATAAALALLVGCGGPKPPPTEAPVEVVVAAAASLIDALTEAKSAFETVEPDTRIIFNFGSSGALKEQIEQGAPVDLFLSAAAEPMEALVEKGLVPAEAVRTVARNRVVLIRSQAAPEVVKSWEDLRLPAVRRVAIGNPQHVPAGQYGKVVLEALSLWADVEPRLVYGEHIRQVLSHVESGEVEAGIVYATDAAVAEVVVVAEAPADAHPPVVYPMAVLGSSAHPAEARAFADFLLTGEGRPILAKYGFEVGD